jgi:glycosyltransferase involved in cell wall biosynthesis
MNIAQISSGELRIPVEKGGGIEAYILHLSKSLSKAGHNVVILDRKYFPADPDVEYIDGVKIVRLIAKRFPRFNSTISFVLNQIIFAYRVKKYLAKADFDILQVHHSVIGLTLAITGRNLRNRLFYLSQTSRRLKKSLSLLDRMALALENQLVKRIKKVIVLNELVREKLITAVKLKPENVVLIPVSIDISRFNTNIEVGDIRQRYGLDERVTILFVGRICADKGVEYLVKAANIVINEFGYKKAQFLLVGPVAQFGSGASARSPYLSKVVKLIEDYGLKQNVRLTGALPLDDLRKLYVACDIFVLPSLTEAMPTASLEAMASGKPVIGTKVGGIPMQIKDGQSGFLIDPEDERQLAERIKYLIDSPSIAKEMGAYGRKLAEEKFDWAIIAERLLQVYRG